VEDGFSIMSDTTALKQEPLSDPKTWVDRHGDYLFRYAVMRLKNEESAEEALQETFVAALKGRDRFKGKSSERTWLVGILKNKIMDHFRKASRERPVSTLEDGESLDKFFDSKGRWKKMPASWNMDPSAHMEKGEFWKVFSACLMGLPDRLSKVFTVLELDELNSEKACNLLNLSMTNLRVMLHRARLQLRACLESNWFHLKGKSK
jgi:RNA polymerase sigma-70 factor (TIGR02943 family)